MKVCKYEKSLQINTESANNKERLPIHNVKSKHTLARGFANNTGCYQIISKINITWLKQRQTWLALFNTPIFFLSPLWRLLQDECISCYPMDVIQAELDIFQKIDWYTSYQPLPKLLTGSCILDPFQTPDVLFYAWVYGAHSRTLWETPTSSLQQLQGSPFMLNSQ